MVKTQQSSALLSSHQLTEQVQSTQTKIGGLIIAGLVAAILIGYLLARAVTKPIDALKDSAYQLSHGKLNADDCWVFTTALSLS